MKRGNIILNIIIGKEEEEECSCCGMPEEECECEDECSEEY